MDVECYDGKGANKIVESSKTLNNHNIKDFIPNYRVLREGIIRFDGQDVPDYVYLFYLRFKLQPYIIQPKICFNCYRFGHMASQCKKPCCRFCRGNPYEPESICLLLEGLYRCINFEGQHFSTDKICPNYCLYVCVSMYCMYCMFETRHGKGKPFENFVVELLEHPLEERFT